MEQIRSPLYWLTEHNIDINNRRIYVFDLVEDEKTAEIIKAIHYFNGESVDEEIELYIRTDGGIVEDMFAIYDTIRQSKAPIHTYGVGCVASAGVVLLTAGHCRFAFQNCWLMHHLSKVISEGDEREIHAQAEANKKLATRTYELLAKHTRKTAKTWEREATKQGEVWLDAEQMLEWGIVDEIIPSPAPPRLKRQRKKRKK